MSFVIIKTFFVSMTLNVRLGALECDTDLVYWSVQLYLIVQVLTLWTKLTTESGFKREV